MKEAILCVDIGSSSIKAAYMDNSPKSVAYGRYSFKEKDTDRAAREWMTGLKAVIDELKGKSPDTQVIAVCISGNGPTIVSDDGLTLMWYKKVPNSISDTKSLWLPRLDGFRKLHTHHWHDCKYILGAPEYLIYSLTGKAVSILPEERYRDIYWSEEVLKNEGFSNEEIAKIPPFAAPGTLAGTLTSEAAEKTGLNNGTPVYCGAPDFISALIGTDTLDTGCMCDRSGSSEGINLCTPVPVTGPNIRTMPSIIPGMWNASVLIPDTGKRFADFKAKVEEETGNPITHKNLVAQIVDYDKPETEKIISKNLQEEGMTIIHDVTHQLWAAFNILKKASADAGLPVPKTMTITGGQALNEKWTQVKCDTLCIPISVTECVDAELVGNNILTRVSMGQYDSIEEAAFALVKKAKTYNPATPADQA